jgi:hypothetical protein
VLLTSPKKKTKKQKKHIIKFHNFSLKDNLDMRQRRDFGSEKASRNNEFRKKNKGQWDGKERKLRILLFMVKFVIAQSKT